MLGAEFKNGIGLRDNELMVQNSCRRLNARKNGKGCRGYGLGILVVYLSVFLCVFNSCSKKTEDEPQENCKQTVLVYMVAANSLAYAQQDDIEEMKVAMSQIDTNNRHLLLFISDLSGTQRLCEMQSDGTSGFYLRTVREYNTEISSVDPKRMAEVFSDTRRLYPADEYGLVLWSHATGWIYSSREKALNKPVLSSFGDEFGHKMNIDKLASTIPDDFFKFIWADCCYMGSVECAWQLRNKCDYYVAYPTEVMGSGMPYDITLPLIMSSRGPQLKEAAKEMFDYYNNMPSSTNRSCTVVVLDQKKLQSVADATRQLYENFIFPDTYGLQLYSRNMTVPLYDFAQYAERVGEQKENTAFVQALNNVVIYKAATPTFLSITINPSNFSGLSTHALTEDENEQEQYYRTLDWYKAVYR